MCEVIDVGKDGVSISWWWCHLLAAVAMMEVVLNEHTWQKLIGIDKISNETKATWDC